MMVLDRDGTFIQDVLADVHHTPSAIADDAQAIELQRGLVLRIGRALRYARGRRPESCLEQTGRSCRETVGQRQLVRDVACGAVEWR